MQSTLAKKSKLSYLIRIIVSIAALAFSPFSQAQNVVPVGSGSYADSVPAADQQVDSYYGLPADQVIQFYNFLHMDASLQGKPIPTNHWWTDMLIANRSFLPTGQTEYTLQQDPYGGQMWVVPSMLDPTSYGLDIYYANSWKAANANGSPQGNIDPGVKLPLHGDVPYHIPAADVLIADFENGYPTGTVITGTGFAATPSTGSGLTNMMGTYCANTRDSGNGGTGTVTFPSFTVTKHYLNFLMCGGNLPGTQVELIVGGNVVLSTGGVNSTAFAWTTWDISPYNGQSAQVKLVDTETGSWGFLAADQIVESDSNSPVGRFGGDLVATNTIVTNWGDWNVSFRMPDGNGNEADFTMARGIPFTWSTWTGMKPKLIVGGTLTYNDTANNPITVTGGQFTASAFSFTFNGKAYGVFLPPNTTVVVGGTGTSTYIEPQLSGTNNYMVLGYLTATTDLATYATYAYAVPTNTALSWTYDPVNGKVDTTWTITTTALQGTNHSTIQGWLPHHYRTTTTNFSYASQTYTTQRGTMKTAIGTSFQINFPFAGIAPVLPAPSIQGLPNEYQASRMTNYLSLFNPGSMDTSETYGSGKALGACAQYMTQAAQMGDTTDFNRYKNALETSLTNWLTYTPGETDGFFAQYSNWHAIIGQQPSYGSQAFNDLHFHYGYYATATAFVGMYDPTFLTNYGPMMKTVLKSYGNYDRTDTSEPFLRMFDVWEGHTNAGGTSSPTGENEESSSESMQSWVGMYMLGSMMNDSQMTAAGAMGFAMQSAAVNEYWEDLYQTNFPSVFGRAWAGQVWGGNITYATYFTADPAWIYAIQYTPSNHWDNYLVRDQVSTASAKYAASWTERANFAAQYPAWSSANAYASGTWVNYNGSLYSSVNAVAAGGATPATDTTDWFNQGDFSATTPDVLTDYPGCYVLAYEAQFDPDTAASQFDSYFTANKQIVAPSGANSWAGAAYYIIHAMRDIGMQDSTYSVSIPTAAVYYNARTNARTLVVFNPSGSTANAIVYHNGASVQTVSVPAHTQTTAYVGTTPVITSSTTAAGMLTAAFNFHVTATNSPTSYSASGLPGGLSISTSTGIISGTPTATGTTTATVHASNASGTGNANLVITIYPFTNPPSITSPLTAPATVGSAFSYTIMGTNSPTGYNATNLPAGLTVNTSTGVISGTPTSVGSTNVSISASNVGGTGSATLVITALTNLGLNQTATASSFQTGSPASAANDGSTSTRWLAANGTFPQWWQVDLGAVDNISRVDINWYSNASRGYGYKIDVSNDSTFATFTTVVNKTTNTATGPTSDSFTAVNNRYVRVTVNSVTPTGGYASAYEIGVFGQPSLPPPVINSALTKSGVTGTAFSYQITATNSPTSFSASPMPAGLSINTTTGVISGTPNTAASTNVTIGATNASGTGTATLVVTIAQAPPVITSPLTASGTTGTAFTNYQITATNSPTSYSATPLPAGLLVNTTTGVISGTPTTVGTTNVTIGATNSGGTGTATLVITISGADTNVAVGKTSTASTFQVGNEVAKANDGSTTTRWAASSAAVPQWWQVDLGANFALSRVDINWYSNATRYNQYTISTSTDGTNFTTRVDKSTNTTDGPTSDSFTATARYVKINVTKTSSGNVSAYEISVFGH